jgi:peptidyl-prolyl cis-trans isomerase A (cyclophilin A)
LLVIFALLAPRSHACDSPGLKSPDQAKATLRLQTTLGRIDLQVDLQHAPQTACNFLKQLALGAYDGGYFGRTVRPDNQTAARAPISVVQGYANPERNPGALGALPLERTSKTGLLHLDGTISMARVGPDDATSEFFICIGDQPELNYGGRRNPDGQGFAAFGRVVRGMDVVRRIQQSPAIGESLSPPIVIQRARLRRHT